MCEPGEWVRYSTPEGAEYIAICLPAFSPDTVHRDTDCITVSADFRMIQPKPDSGGKNSPRASDQRPTLLRTMGLFSLVVYGVGDMVGSGIYGTVGNAAAQMGNAVWLAFVVSMVAAMLTGLSYACLVSRYPRAAGAAYVTQRAFHFAFLSYLIGLMVTASGLTSMATSTNVFADSRGERWSAVAVAG